MAANGNYKVILCAAAFGNGLSFFGLQSYHWKKLNMKDIFFLGDS
jgi:hypothetical protein